MGLEISCLWDGSLGFEISAFFCRLVAAFVLVRSLEIGLGRRGKALEGRNWQALDFARVPPPLTQLRATVLPSNPEAPNLLDSCRRC